MRSLWLLLPGRYKSEGQETVSPHFSQLLILCYLFVVGVGGGPASFTWCAFAGLADFLTAIDSSLLPRISLFSSLRPSMSAYNERRY